MKGNLKNNEFILASTVIFIFTFYRSFPKSVQVFLPLILGIYYVFYTGILIYKRRHWEEILRAVIIFIVSAIMFIDYYNSAFKFDDSFSKITLIVVGWTFPCLAYTGAVSFKRNGELRKYGKSLYLLAYGMFLAIFCTIVAIM